MLPLPLSKVGYPSLKRLPWPLKVYLILLTDRLIVSGDILDHRVYGYPFSLSALESSYTTPVSLTVGTRKTARGLFRIPVRGSGSVTVTTTPTGVSVSLGPEENGVDPVSTTDSPGCPGRNPTYRRLGYSLSPIHTLEEGERLEPSGARFSVGKTLSFYYFTDFFFFSASSSLLRPYLL